MLKKLNPWHRLWLMFVAVFLASTLAVIAAAWPKPDAGIVADLRAPDCKEWREGPAGIFPERYPGVTEPCYAIRLFLLEQRENIRSEEDYSGYLARKGAGTTLTFLAIWAGFSAGTFVLGWSTNKLVGRVRLKLRERRGK